MITVKYAESDLLTVRLRYTHLNYNFIKDAAKTVKNSLGYSCKSTINRQVIATLVRSELSQTLFNYSTNLQTTFGCLQPVLSVKTCQTSDIILPIASSQRLRHLLSSWSFLLSHGLPKLPCQLAEFLSSI